MSWWKLGRKASEPEVPADPNMPVIRLEHISRVFEGNADEETRALDDVSVDIQRGEYVAVSGPSGCGKSTFLSIVGLLDTATLAGAALATEAFQQQAGHPHQAPGHLGQLHAIE